MHRSCMHVVIRDTLPTKLINTEVNHNHHSNISNYYFSYKQNHDMRRWCMHVVIRVADTPPTKLINTDTVS